MSIEIEGPYSFKDVDGLVAPVYIYEPGGEKKIVGKAAVKVKGGMTFEVSLTEEYKDIKMASFEVPMRFAYLKEPQPKINWGYNCLTIGVHHGRPEALWNLSLLQATITFEHEELKQIVVARIYNDSIQLVEHGVSYYTQEWAEKMRQIAKQQFDDILTRKIDELQKYYTTSSWRRDVEGVISLVKHDKLNPHYQPLHSHDSINLLCRIIGQSCLYEASLETSE